MRYAIRNTEDPSEWWSNEYGWTTQQLRDTFSQRERATLNLPMEGEWMEIDGEYSPTTQEGTDD